MPAKRLSATQRWQGVVAIVLVVGFTGLIYIGLLLRATGPDYYQPARTALVEARQKLEASYNHEAVLLEQLRSTHHDLEAAIVALAQARVSPGDELEVAKIQTRLRALEDVRDLEKLSPEQLHQSYRDIEAQLTALVEKLERTQDDRQSD